MKTLLIALLIVFLAVAVVGFVVKALLWLAVVGLILFVLTAIYWWVRAKQSHSADAR